VSFFEVYTMKNLGLLLGAMVFAASCGGEAPKPAEPPAPPPGPKQEPLANLAQLMRAIPFPNSNIIFDAQTHDPGAPPKPAKEGESASARFSAIYTGWPLVEHAAAALTETANLLMIPGRMCQNGRPAPQDRDDWKKGVEGLANAGRVALKAAQARNLEQIVEASNTVAEACAACHEIYRDVPDEKDRCIPPADPGAAAKPPAQ
jgi:hypothetical protein